MTRDSWTSWRDGPASTSRGWLVLAMVVAGVVGLVLTCLAVALGYVTLWPLFLTIGCPVLLGFWWPVYLLIVPGLALYAAYGAFLSLARHRVWRRWALAGMLVLHYASVAVAVYPFWWTLSWHQIDRLGQAGQHVPIRFILWLALFVGVHVVAIWWVFRARIARKPGLCPQCGYDLRGTVAAGRTTCPECGQFIRDASAVPLVDAEIGAPQDRRGDGEH